MPRLEYNPLVPELTVSHLATSLTFWLQLGFEVVYQRPEHGFAYLRREGAQVMLEQLGAVAGQWLSAPLATPFGRGINLQIDVAAIAPLIDRLSQAGIALFRPSSEQWYRAGTVEVGQRECLVQDPDGYLLRFVERLGERPARSG